MITTLSTLPSEIVLNIIQFLPPFEIVNLQYVSRQLLQLCRDDGLWREESFQASLFLEKIRRRRNLVTDTTEDPRFTDLARALAHNNGQNHSRLQRSPEEASDSKAQSKEKIRLRANWDPSFPKEKVNWYDEYIARNAPISTSWFEQPRNRDSAEKEYLEVRGMAIYTPEPGTTLVVAPLDDGSIALWALSGTNFRKGSIVARSKSGLLSVNADGHNPSREFSQMISTGVNECIAVDSARKRAYIAVQSWLVEIDLERLVSVAVESFPFPITALSEAKHPIPLTVGTSFSLHLYDSRIRWTGQSLSHFERVESQLHPRKPTGLNFRSLINPEPSPEYAPLYELGPLNILHLPSSGDEWNGNGDIYVAGRFPSILNYDRRNFPKLRGNIHSGARLSSMTSLPFPFSSIEKDLARRGELSIEQVLEYKMRPGNTLIACGEYNTKGSLEMYGLSPEPLLTTISSISSAGRACNAVMKNRQTSSSSKLLSVASHGTRIVVSDGGGNLKWLERDGFTEVRRWNISHGSVEAPRGIFGSLGDNYMDSGSGDIVIKILENEGDLVLWTGEKIGLLNFSSKPGFIAESFQNTVKTAEEIHQEREQRVYSNTMRRALEHQANEVRYVRGLGLGFGGSGN